MGQLGSSHSGRGLFHHVRSISHRFISSWSFDCQVGAYGEVESETGELRVDGNIYDPEFQDELNRLGLRLHVADHPPQEGAVEEDFIIASKGAKRMDLHLGPEACVSPFTSHSRSE